MKNRKLYILAALTACVVGLFAYVSFSLFIMNKKYHQAREALTVMRDSLEIAAIMRYGTVVSINVPERTLSVHVTYMFSREDSSRPIVVKIAEDAYVAYEELIARGNVYVALSNRRPADFSEIQVGDRVAFYAQRKNGSIVTYQILFGNPL